ncbi:F510_1955 family glycosylhydrolase [Evansella clarkii]|uniref:F510_1955 family glycosylhydrolase n=1 Tax=Evansella clarkii TaxID=79879 RepID=UPI00099634B7|nr:hypothetical protein [Evansella clarkii]
MDNKEAKMFAFFSAILIILTGCTTGEEEPPAVVDGPERDLSEEAEQPNEDNEQQVREAVEEIEHIHDMAFDREEEGILYVGTHYGLMHADLNSGEFYWQGTEEDRHDFMGFLITAENIFMSSGHPGHGSELENPLGVMKSEDHGGTWETGALYSEVDFHLMDANEGDSEYLYGFDAYGGRMFKSQDGGEDWSEVSAEGINDRFHELYSIISDPEDSERVLAGMANGIYESLDGGENFNLFNNELTMTSVSQGPDGILFANGIGRIEGLMKSTDFGETWEVVGELPEEAAPVLAIAVDHNNTDTLAIGTASDSIYWSDDQGKTWQLIVENGEPA